MLILTVGKITEPFVKAGIKLYFERLKHYGKFEIKELPDIKNAKSLSEEEQKRKEAEIILKVLPLQAYLIVLDERAKQFTSEEWSGLVSNRMNQSAVETIFLIGGPYGIHKSIIERAQESIALSKMTFTHQMAALFFIEQMYRACSIMRGEPYHHR